MSPVASARSSTREQVFLGFLLLLLSLFLLLAAITAPAAAATAAAAMAAMARRAIALEGFPTVPVGPKSNYISRAW